MLPMWSAVIIHWIKDELRRQRISGKNQKGLARQMGISEGQVSQLLKGGGQRGLDVDELPKIISYLNVPLPHHLPIAQLIRESKLAPLVGKIKAGTWLESEAMSTTYKTQIPYVPDEEYKSFQQYAYQVADESANNVAISGSYLICVDFLEARPNGIEDGDEVIIREYITMHGAKKAKRVFQDFVRVAQKRGGEVFLIPSTQDFDEEHVVRFDPSCDNLRITSLVIGVYRPRHKMHS